MSEVCPSDVSFDVDGVRFEMETGYWGTIAPGKAQALALEILSRWPLERQERDTVVGDWKADATRYLKDSNMLIRRFARRTLVLTQAVEDAMMQLTLHGLMKEALTSAEAAVIMKDGE